MAALKSAFDFEELIESVFQLLAFEHDE